MLPRASTTAEDPVTQKAGPLRLPSQGTKEKRNDQVWKNLCELWGNIHRNNLRIIGVPEGDRGRKGQRLHFKNNTRKVPNLMRFRHPSSCS